jgi:hypothetical protein
MLVGVEAVITIWLLFRWVWQVVEMAQVTQPLLEYLVSQIQVVAVVVVL